MKKVKLFTTIASLCLAVALMAFGVYAATTTATITIGGNIQFNATGLTGTWSWTASGSSNVTITGNANGTDSDPAVNFTVNDENEATLTLVVRFTNTSDVGGTLSAKAADEGNSANVTLNVADTDTFTSKSATDGKKETAEITVTVKFTAANENTNESGTYSIVFTAEKA